MDNIFYQFVNHFDIIIIIIIIIIIMQNKCSWHL